MTRDVISLTISDMSAFARALAREAGGETGHQAWLNRIARAAGYRNYQHLAALRKSGEPAANEKAVRRALRYFDDSGQMSHWPAKQGVRLLCVWVIWARLPRGGAMSERGISEAIDALTGFRDAAIIRRMLVDTGLFSRARDGSDYRRIERRPPPEALALIRAVGEKTRP